MAGVEFCPPQFTLSLKSQEAEEGGVARFEAVVSGEKLISHTVFSSVSVYIMIL